MSVRYTLSAEDGVEAHRLGMRLNPAMRALRWLAMAALLWLLTSVLISLFTHDGSGVGDKLAYAAAMALALMLPEWMIPFTARRHYAQMRALREEQHLEWSDDGPHWTAVTGSGRLTWQDFRKWAQTKNLVILFPADRLMYIVPKRAFSAAELGSFLGHLAAGVKQVRPPIL